jgi:hypothetical protein
VEDGIEQSCHALSLTFMIMWNLEIYLQFLSEKEEKRPIKKKGDENSNPFSHWLRQCIKRGGGKKIFG